MEIKYTDKDEAEMVLIPAGDFVFGISDERLTTLYGQKSSVDRYRNEIQELHEKKVELPAYYMDRYLVTNRRYGLFLRDQPDIKRPPYLDSSLWGGAEQPVVGITWADATAFASWVEKRLPTEQEWEKAARGTEGQLFPWGDDLRKVYCNSTESGLECTSIVGSFPQSVSPYGLHDMAGNVWEMTSSKYDDNHNVMKGGSYLTYQIFCRVTARWYPSEDEMRRLPHWLGFRCVS